MWSSVSPKLLAWLAAEHQALLHCHLYHQQSLLFCLPALDARRHAWSSQVPSISSATVKERNTDIASFHTKWFIAWSRWPLRPPGAT